MLKIDSIPNRSTDVGPLIRGAWSRQHDELGRDISGEFLNLGRVSPPALDTRGQRTVFTEVIEYVAVPSLRDKNREHGADVIGTLGRMFLRNSRFTLDSVSGTVELQIYDQPNGAQQ